MSTDVSEDRGAFFWDIMLYLQVISTYVSEDRGAFFWDVMLYRQVNVYRRFGGSWCLLIGYHAVSTGNIHRRFGGSWFLLGCHAVSTGKHLPKFRRIVLPFSGMLLGVDKHLQTFLYGRSAFIFRDKTVLLKERSSLLRTVTSYLPVDTA